MKTRAEATTATTSSKQPDRKKPPATDWPTLLAQVPANELDAEFVRRYGLPSPFQRKPGKPWTVADWID